MEKVKYEEMLPHEIVTRRKLFPAAFIGLGGLEWHGEHLAVGNDALKAEKLCELAALQSGGFAFPTLWYGEPRVAGLMESGYDKKDDIQAKMQFKKRKFSTLYFGKTAKQQIEFYRELLYHLLIQMNTLEMKGICLLCGHYPLCDWASPVVEKFNNSFEDSQAFTGTEFHYLPKSQYVGGDHAGKWETSYLWYLRPDCVDISIYLKRDEETLVGVGDIDPRKEASIEIGRKACALIVTGMTNKAKELIKNVEQHC